MAGSDDSTETAEKPGFSHKRGFYFEPFDLILTAETAGSSIRYTTDNTKPSKTKGTLYTEPVHIQGMTTIRAVAYQENTICSGVRTHSFIFPADVLTQDNSGVPDEQHGNDHVYWTEEFDMSDVDCTEEEMIGALLDLPSFFISVPWDSMFGIAGIHRGQNLEEHGGDPNHPDWIELVECSVELIYPENYCNGIYNNWQENCGIKIQGGASRWHNGSLDHKQSFTLKFKDKYGKGMLDNNFLATAPFNRESVPEKFDKLILRTGFNRDFGSDWDRANYAYTRDQFGRDLQIMMSGWGCHGTYTHLYINGKYWGHYNPCERMDDHALASYFGGESEDYFYGKGKGGVQSGNAERYHYLNNTNWTNKQLFEIEQYLALDVYIDVALLHCYANAGDCPQYYFGCSTNPPGQLYYTAWDIEDSFDGGGRRTGPPVSMENYNMPYSQDKFEAYFKMRKNIDFKMKFADRAFKHCFYDGVFADNQVIAIWDSSCRVIDKSMFCEIARWGDERGSVYGYEHWLNECGDVRDDLTGRAELFVDELIESGMYPNINPPEFKNGENVIFNKTYNCNDNFMLTIAKTYPGVGNVYYTTNGTDPRKWDLTGDISDSAIELTESAIAIPITEITIVKARMKNSNTWSPLRELKIIPENTSSVVINEINYDSYPTFDTEDWVELYNNSDTDISLAGWKLKDSKGGNVFIFGQQTVLCQDSFLVVCHDILDFKELFPGVENCIGNIDFKFGNEGDLIQVFNSDNILIDFVSYNNEHPWPGLAGGRGSTLELIKPEYDNTQPESWQASKFSGSPGRSNKINIFTEIIEYNEIQNRPTAFTLSQNYPNPFNPTTNIKYNIASAGIVTLKIYNLTGQEVKTLVNDFRNPGEYSVKWTVQGIVSGIYLYQLTTPEFSATKKLVVIK